MGSCPARTAHSWPPSNRDRRGHVRPGGFRRDLLRLFELVDGEWKLRTPAVPVNNPPATPRAPKTGTGTITAESDAVDLLVIVAVGGAAAAATGVAGAVALSRR